jgi:hypothetical protein
VVIDPTPVEVFAGHNLASADRINLVVGGEGFTSQEAFLSVVRAYFDPAAEPVFTDRDGERTLHFPVFSIEPFRSNAHRFNIWYLADSVGRETFNPWSRIGESTWDEFDVSFLGLPHMSTLVLTAGPAGSSWASGESQAFAWTTSIPPQTQSEFFAGHANVSMDPTDMWPASDTVVHELGHSLFGLRDEYGPPARPGLRPEDVSADLGGCRIGLGLHHTPRPPNCAISLTDAEARWGDLVGDLDPFFDEYRQSLESYGLWEDGPYHARKEDVTVGYHVTAEWLKPT